MGLAAGDRIGGPIEMALALSASLIKNNGFIREEIANAYVKWWKNGGIDAGITTRTSLELIKTKKSLDSASSITNTRLDNKTAGCNPTHRIIPLAVNELIYLLWLLKKLKSLIFILWQEMFPQVFAY